MRVLRRADSKLQSKYNLKATFGQSALDKDAKTGAGGKKISVLLCGNQISGADVVSIAACSMAWRSR